MVCNATQRVQHKLVHAYESQQLAGCIILQCIIINLAFMYDQMQVPTLVSHSVGTTTNQCSALAVLFLSLRQCPEGAHCKPKQASYS